MHPTASGALVALFLPLPILVALMVVLGWWKATRGPLVRGLAFVAAWLAAVAGIGASGVLTRWDSRPPPLVVLLIVLLAATVTLALSPIGRKVAEGLPLAALVGFHAFRLPLELVMHRAATEGTMPVQMSYSGLNFDIVSGISAIIAAFLVARGVAARKVAIAWSALGSILLVVVLSIAIASMPLIAAFGPDRLMTWVTWFPFVLLPGVLVPAALFGHIVLWRRLLTRS
jgi:hypothetical protein